MFRNEGGEERDPDCGGGAGTDDLRTSSSPDRTGPTDSPDLEFPAVFLGWGSTGSTVTRHVRRGRRPPPTQTDFVYRARAHNKDGDDHGRGVG